MSIKKTKQRGEFKHAREPGRSGELPRGVVFLDPFSLETGPLHCDMVIGDLTETRVHHILTTSTCPCSCTLVHTHIHTHGFGFRFAYTCAHTYLHNLCTQTLACSHMVCVHTLAHNDASLCTPKHPRGPSGKCQGLCIHELGCQKRLGWR